MYLIFLLVLSVMLIVVSTSRYKIHPFLALLVAGILFALFSGMPLAGIVEAVNQGFGGTIGQIGIVIVAGVIIGTFLEESGGAHAMARRILKLTGRKRVTLTMSIVGYIVSIPVFCDSGFVILNSLNKALTKEARLSLVGTAEALALGLMITHVLVPPTPGPIAAAGILEADLGLVILLGVIVSLPVLVISWLFSAKVASRMWLDPDPEGENGPGTEDGPDSNKSPETKNGAGATAISPPAGQAPSAIHAFLPILVPILLIVLKSVAAFPTAPLGTGTTAAVLGFIGEPVIALLLGVLLALTLPKKLDRSMLSTTGWAGKAMQNAALIILITGAGGAFGNILRQSELATVLSDSITGLRIGILLPFLLAAALKTAQGSSTVALITAASLMSPLMLVLGFDSDMARALVVLAIGAGSLVVSHANDSMFWVVTQMTGMDVKTGYRAHTMGTLTAGVSAFLFLWIASLILL
ncbi:MAG: GntP family permease [Bacteroidales bacterium]